MPKLSQPRPAAYIEDDAAELIPPPPAAPDPNAGRAIVIVLPAGPYSAQEYSDSAAEIMRVCSNRPTPAPQLAEALRRAVSDWADAQQLNTP